MGLNKPKKSNNLKIRNDNYTPYQLSRTINYPLEFIDVNDFIASYPTIAVIRYGSSSNYVQRQLLNASAGVLKVDNIFSIPETINSLATMLDGVHILSSGSSGNRYIMKNDVLIKTYNLSYTQEVIYSDGVYKFSKTTGVIYIYKNDVLIHSSSITNAVYKCIKVANNAFVLMLSDNSTPILFIINDSTVTKINSSASALESSIDSLKTLIYKISGGRI